MKTINYKIILILVTIIFLHANSNAQNIIDANFITVVVPNTTTHTANCMINISDTVNVSEIEIQIGSTSSNSDIVNYSFVFDQANSLPNGFSYIRNAYLLNLGVGAIQSAGPYFSRFRLKDMSGNWSTPFEFITD